MAIQRLTILTALAALTLVAAGWSAPKVIENGFGDPQTGGGATDPSGAKADPPLAGGNPQVWSLPQVQARLLKLRLAAAQVFKQGRYADAEKLAQQFVDLAPHDAAGYYLLASTQAVQDKKEAALDNLAKAVELGFNKSAEMSRDPNLRSLYESRRFAELIADALVAEPPAKPRTRTVATTAVRDHIAMVSAANTGWDAKHGLFVALFKLPPAERTNEAVKGGPADQINAWYREGTAAGNYGDLYDNHDGHHSRPTLQFFPQLTLIEFDEDTKRRNLHMGLQNRFLYNGIVVGNSSTALVKGPYWRSQARLAYVNKRNVAVLYNQYVNNHLYCYPEHHDHDPDKGDVFTANTPYVIISQGSSGSDRPSMNAVLYTLAAFRPEVKKFLAENHALMPTIQLLARYCHDNLKKPEDYLTGKAHPTVFNSYGFSAERMAASAHALTKETVPPLVKLKVIKDDPSQVGRDYFDIGARQEIFTTPCAIARVHRTTNYFYHMIVSAEDSTDLNGRDLTYHWKVLRGDADRIVIKPRNESGSIVELAVPFHSLKEIEEGGKVKSSRVDIGCFVNNGLYYSAPAFVTIYSLPDEQRGYLRNGKVAFVQYTTPADGAPYVDPMIDLPKDWKDTYQYDDDGRLIGWIRERNGKKAQFTADGAIVTARDESGRPLIARTVRYTSHRPNAQAGPVLRQQLGNEQLHYAYDSPEDRVGHVVKREAAPAE